MEIIKWISQTGLMGVGAIAVFLAFQYFYGKIKKIKVANPLNHPFFNTILYNKNVKLKSIKLYSKGHGHCEGRDAVFKDMLNIKFQLWHDHTKHVVSLVSTKYTYISDSDFEEIWTSGMMQCAKEYEMEWMQSEIPEIVINKFNEWHGSHADILFNTLKNICHGNSFSTKEEQTNAILELQNALIIITMIDAEKTLGSLNGDLTGIKYKGIVLK